jgi:alpha-2-macroglobulin
MFTKTLLGGAALAVVAGVLSFLSAPSQDDLLKQADDAFQKKEYSVALAAYQAAAKLPELAKERDRVRLRIGATLARLDRWDEALAALEDLAAGSGDALWAARAALERGVIAATMPHQAYEKDGKRTRGSWVQGATYVWTAHADFKNAVADLERAGQGLAAVVADPARAPEKKRIFDDLLRARLELAAALEAGAGYLAEAPADTAPASRPAPWYERMIAAFDGAVAAATEAADREAEALARYLKGAACVRLLNHFRRYELAGGGEILHRPPNVPDSVPMVKLPASWNPLAVLTEAAERAKGTKLAVETVMALGAIQNQLGLYVDAVKTWESVVRDHPKSPYVADAREGVEQVTFPRLSMASTHVHLPGEKFAIDLQTRNLKSVSVRIMKVPLDELYQSPRWLDDPEVSFGDPRQTYEKWGQHFPAGKVHQLGHDTGDDGLHRPITSKVDVPPLANGAYVVEALAGDAGELIWRSLLLVSDLSVAAKFDRDRIVAFVADSFTGKPVAGATVVIRQKHVRERRTTVRHSTLTTDGRGLAEKERAFADGWINVECFASIGGRFAMIDRANWHAPQRFQEQTTAYVMTDRPVYRPGDPVRIAAVLRQRKKEHEYEALAGRTVRMIVRDPKGQPAFDQRLKTDDSGAFSQEMTFAKDAPLGVWHVQIERDGRHVHSGNFRIEEYLKPEFEVTVSLPKEQVRLGSKIPVGVEAAYYFGGGVPGAEVSWRVFREEYVPFFSWHRHWMDGGEGFERRRGGGRELVVSGQGTLSSDGKLELAFDTAPFASLPGEGSNFVVEADVMDASRRTISGSARLLLAKKALVLGVQPRRGFYSAGDFVECETQSRLPAGAPVAARGTMKVFRVVPEVQADGKPALNPDGTVKEVRRLLHEEPHATDQNGVGFFRWQPDEGGLFAIAFEALDRFEQLVTGEARLWIYKPGEAYRDFAFANIELVPEQRTYAPGQVAKVLIKSALPDGAVFYSVDAGQKMLRYDTLNLAGKLGVLEVPIERGHVPNIHVHVIAVAGGKFFEDRLELFVPPEDRFLDVKLAYAKDAYRPGETGDLVVTTRTSSGAPVPARLAVTVLDASILAIQSDESADIRKFFYGSRRYASTQRDSSAGLDLRGYLARDVKWSEHDTVGGLPAWGGPNPGMVSRLFRGEGFGVAELETWAAEEGASKAKLFGRTGGAGARRRQSEARGLGEGAATGAPPPGAPAPEGLVADARAEMKSLGDDDALDKGGFAGAPAEEDAPPQARKDFRDSALWTADVATDASGTATIKVPFPESLTTWRAKAWAWTADTLVGQATADVKTTKDVLVRLRAPRFFVEGDAITVAALVNNRTDKPQTARVKLTLDGDHLATAQPVEVETHVPANSDRRVDWTVNVLKAGEAKIAAQVIAQADQDALEMTFPVLEWGHDKTLTRAAVLENDAASELTFAIPAERRVETTVLELSMQPSLALLLLDALPYLVDFPYGCTEQTASRFIPAAIVAKILGDSGVTLEDIAGARAPVPKQRAKDHGRVLSTAELQHAVRSGLDRLASMQHGDGGFGWWKDDDSSPYLTAYVLQGLVIGREADLPVPAGMIERAAAFLAGALQKEERLEQAAFVSYVLARAGKPDAKVLDRIFTNRDALNAYGKALLASALKAAGKADQAGLVLRNLADFAERDDANGTAHWKATSRHWWWWWNNLVETNAAVLNAFVDVEPDHALVRPLVKWLVTNRRGGSWTNTRDTAHSVLALARYAKASGELDPALSVEVSVDGGPPKTLSIDRRNVWLFDGRMLFGPEAVRTGDVKVSIKTRGKGRLYVSGQAKFFTKEADITAAGNELLVQRTYVRVRSKPESRKVDGREVTQMVDSFEPLSPGAEIRAGDVVEVRLGVDAKNDYDYLFFEDLKPAGFEPLEVKSGHRHGAGIASNVEYRDTRTAMFVNYLQQGTHTLAYRLRAEVPGTLRVLPARGEAMYAPDIAGTSSSFRFTVLDPGER